MSIKCTDRAGLEAYMKDRLTDKRYRHSLGVEKMASELAEIYGADIEKAAFAGRYHDIAKCLTAEESDALVRKYNLPDKYIGNIALAHSKLAAEILKNEFGVTDEEILDAVRSHTTGRVEMSLLEEIVYSADAIEENRSYPELEELQELAGTDLDKACLAIMDFAVEMILDKGRELDTDTLEAREFIRERINNKN